MESDAASARLSDLAETRKALDVVDGAVSRATAALSARSDGGRRLDEHQVLAYDIAHSRAGVETGRAALAYGEYGEDEARLSALFVADVIADVTARTVGREEAFGLHPGWHGNVGPFLALARAPASLAEVAELPGQGRLQEDFELVRETFRRFAEERIGPVAERVHRENADIPEDVISGIAELGGFGLSVPEEFGGFATGGEHDYLGMVVATEELSRVSLGAGGALITRPEILTRALLIGGTDEQRRRLLPAIAAGEKMVAVAVTEPDYGSDVAQLNFTAVSRGDGFVLNGVKTWSTFAARAELLMLLARTDPDRSRGHRGLSLFVVEKPKSEPAGFCLEQLTSDAGRPPGLGPGRLVGRPIDTIGYRGMHSYELAFDNFYVGGESLVGGPDGAGRGFYLQMAGFENGRLQTAARAIGVMQAAYEAALSYSRERSVFGHPLLRYELTRAKLGRMAVLIQASRQFAYDVARKMAVGEAALEAAMVKAYACRASEWVTREAMQIHGGMGYAEEFPVSRLFVDARVLSIFEGADETLCLRVIARRLAEQASRR